MYSVCYWTSPSSLFKNPLFTGHWRISHWGVVVITTAKLHSNNPELRFCAGSSPARSMLGDS